MSQITLILVSIFMGAIGQMLLKAGANKLVEFNLSISNIFQSIWSLIKNPYVVIGAVFFGLSSLLWIKVLTKSELSQAYPMVSLSYVIVTIGSTIFFNEALTLNKILGVSAIVLGVFILNR